MLLHYGKKQDVVEAIDVQLVKLAEQQREILRRAPPQPKRQQSRPVQVRNDSSTNDDAMDVDDSDDVDVDVDVETDLENDDDDDDRDLEEDAKG